MAYENGVYSFQDVACTVAGPGIKQSASGLAEEGYSIELEGDKDVLVMGAGGAGMHSLVAAQNGTITLRLLKTGILNQAFCNSYNFQTGSAANHGQNTIVIDDPVRGDTITAYGAGFRKFPNISYARTAGTQDWVFNCTRIEFSLGPGIVTFVN